MKQLSSEDKKEVLAIAVKLIKLSNDFLHVGEIKKELDDADYDEPLSEVFDHLNNSWGSILDLLGLNDKEFEDFVELHSKKF